MWSPCFFDDSVVTRGNTKNLACYTRPKNFYLTLTCPDSGLRPGPFKNIQDLVVLQLSKPGQGLPILGMRPRSGRDRREVGRSCLLALLTALCFAIGVLGGRQISRSLEAADRSALRGSRPSPPAAVQMKTNVSAGSSPAGGPLHGRSGSIPVVDPEASSFHVDADSFLELPTGLDRPGVLISLFARLDCTHVSTMRTLFSNKAAGCDSSPDHFGLALFVNDWQTSDQLLHLEFGSRRSGCEKLASGTRVECGEWHYFGLHSSESRVAVYLDGVEVGSKDWDAASRREPQGRRPLTFGRFPESTDAYPLLGNISRVSISYVKKSEEVPALLKRLMDVHSSLPLDEDLPRHHFVLPPNDEVARELEVKDGIHGLIGKCKVAIVGDDLVAAFRYRGVYCML